MEHLRVQGHDIPRLGLGTAELEGWTCRHAVAEALELGYRHIDTAEAYGNEREIGVALAESHIARNRLFLTTKVWWENLQADDIRRHLDGSLDRLGTDHVDLLLIHWNNPEVPLDEPLTTMKQLQEEGRIGLIGVSNFTPQLMEQAVKLAPIACNQVEYHPFLGQDQLLDLARRHDHMLTAYCPIARNEVADDPVIQSIASKHGRSPAQIALRWLMQQKHVAAIPRSSTREHLQENLEVFEFVLDDEEMEAIFDLARNHRLVDPDFAPAWRR